MPKVIYNDIKFDSELEVEYYKLLYQELIDNKIKAFFYHPQKPIQITRNNFYTPDFVVFYGDRIEIIETKGYNPYSKMRDDMIHQVMLQKDRQELRDWLWSNYGEKHLVSYNFNSFDVVYRKIKYLKAYGFVDWDFKNPNTIANKRKEKINDLEVELKELKEFKKNALRYFGYSLKLITGKKLTKNQLAWHKHYFDEMMKNIEESEDKNQ